MLQARYEIAAPDVIAELLDGEVLIVNLATGVYFRGDSSTSQAWTAVISGSIAAPEASRGVHQLQAFIETLLTEGLIRECTSDGPGETVHAELPSGPFQLEKYEDLQDMLCLDPIHDVDPNTGWPQPL